ncbi:MAG: rhomboid family intramembrane serine protease [Acidobacteria bacterium]|nr:MAG: rhomboid family intramembrane serine protease [Acidobacteriota bacterium]REK05612.1 MAG: rhomboid family intramembrane serine protease [Acidobacteriota bacterium]
MRTPWKRQTSGSTVCRSCGRLVGVKDERCFHCGQRNPGLFGIGPMLRALGEDLGFGKLVITVCLALYLIGLAMDPSGMTSGGLLGLLSPTPESNFLLGSSGGFPIFAAGRWWTPLSAGWLHGGLLHIGFNLYWCSMLAPAVARLYGPGRAAILFVGSSAAGFVLTSVVFAYFSFLPGFLQGAYNTVGASAAIFGWIGALIHYGRRSGSRLLEQQMMGFVLPMLILGLLVPFVDNWAHIGGLAGGYGLARWLDPLKQERLDHVVVGLGLVVLSLVAVAVSWATGHQFLR